MAQLQSTGITGSLTVTTGSATELLVTNTGVRIGNVIGDTHTVTGSLNISGSLGTVGTITATTLIVQTITSSVSTVTGSTKFGIVTSNTHQFTGSVQISGSLTINGSTSGSSFSGSLLGTASRADNATSASFASTAVSSSFATNAVSASFATNAANAYIQGGNSFGTTALLGTNDAQNLQFETNGTVRMTISGSNSNIGINTITPLNKLHIVADTAITSSTLLRLDGGAVGFSGPNEANISQSIEFWGCYYDNVTIGQTVGAAISMQKNGTWNQFDGGNGTTRGNIIFSTNSGSSASPQLRERVRIQFDGNVGIGTSTPQNALHVHGTSDGLGYIRITDSVTGATSSDGVRIGYNSGVLRLQNYENSDIQFLTNNTTEAIRIKSDGNVGIGTTSPERKLTIVGPSSSPADQSGTLLITDGTGANTDHKLQLGIVSNTYAWIQSVKPGTDNKPLLLNPSGGNIGIGTTTASFKLHVVESTALSVASQPGIISQFTYNVDGRTLARIENSSNNTSAQATAVGLSLVAYSDSSNNPTASKHEAQILLGAKTSGQDGVLRIIAPRDINFLINAQNTVMTGSAFSSYGTFAATITSGGNVGINTTSPASSLHVNGNATIGYSTATSAPSTGLLIRGIVGINTTSPTGHQLDIASEQGGANNSAIRAKYPSGGGLANTEFGALAYRDGVWTAVYGKQGSASSAGYFDGNVGINTSTPSTQLDIRGSGSAQEVGLLMRSSAAGGRTFRIFTNPSWATGSLQIYDTTSDNSIIHINSSGNVGINVGAVNPTLAKLQVQGNVSASSFTGSLLGTASTATSATSATYVNGTSGQLYSKDDRIIEPNSITSGYMQFGFTSWANNNSSPYADYIHLRSYTDSSGGTDNLLMFLKSGFGIRTWQQTFNSASAYSSYRDVALISGSNTGYVPFWTQTNQLLDSALYYNGTNIGIGTTSPSNLLHIRGTGDSGGILTRFTGTGPSGSITIAHSGNGGSLGYAAIGSGANTFYITTGAGTIGSGITMDNNGNVGITTTGAQLRLQVVGSEGGPQASGTAQSGSIRFGGGDLVTDMGTYIAGGVTYYAGWIQATNKTALGTKYNLLLNPGGGSVGIGTFSPASTFHVNGNTTIGYSSLTAAPSTGLLVNGSVGIGTTVANAKLQVEGDIRINSAIYSAGSYVGFLTPVGAALPIKVGGITISDSYSDTNPTNGLSVKGSVGIGTTAPDQLLRINGTAGQPGTSGTTQNGIIRMVGWTTASNSGYGETLDMGFHIGLSGPASYAWLQSTNWSDLSIRYNLALNPRGGNVGIGTAAPAQALDVSGSVIVRANTGNNDLYFIAASRPSIYVNSTNIGLQVRSNGTGILQLNADNSGTGDIDMNSGLIRLDADVSRVGIGTTAPGLKLDVVGSSRIQASSGSNSSVTLDLTAGNGNYDSYIDYGYWSSTFDATLWQVGNYGSDSSKFKIRAAASGTPFDRIVVTQGGDVYMAITGSVGVGITSPTAKLHIANLDAGSDGLVYQKWAYTAGTTGVYELILKQTVTSGVVRYNFSMINASTAYDNVLVLDRGNVGIGITTPSASLHIKNSGNAQLRLQAGTDNPWDLYSVYNQTNSDLFFQMNGSTKVTFNSSGNVGIGTTIPVVKLDVTGDGRFTSDLTANRLYTGNMGISLSSYGSLSQTVSGQMTILGHNVIADVSTANKVNVVNGGWVSSMIKMYYSEGITFHSSATSYAAGATFYQSSGVTNEVMRITNAGNVGIGSTAPAYALDVNGQGRFISNGSSRVLFLVQNATNAGNIIQFQNESKADIGEIVYRNNQFYVYSNATSGFMIYANPSNNNVGIGYGTTSYKLDVNGDIRATADVIAYSDARVKENVKTIENALDKVQLLRGVTYTRKDIDDKSEKVGVIAQEVLEVLPQVVSQDSEGQYSVAYGNMVGILIEAIKELKAEIEELKRNK